MRIQLLTFVLSLLLITALQGCGSSSKTFSQRKYLNLEKPKPAEPLPSHLAQTGLTNETPEISKTDSSTPCSANNEDSLKKKNTIPAIYTIHQYEQADSTIVLSVGKRNYYLVNTVLDTVNATLEGSLIRTPFEACPADSLICVSIEKYEAIDTNRIRINNADIDYVSNPWEEPGKKSKPDYGRFWLFFGLSKIGLGLWILAVILFYTAGSPFITPLLLLGPVIHLVFGILATLEVIRLTKSYKKAKEKSAALKLALFFLGFLAIIGILAACFAEYLSYIMIWH